MTPETKSPPLWRRNGDLEVLQAAELQGRDTSICTSSEQPDTPRLDEFWKQLAAASDALLRCRVLAHGEAELEQCLETLVHILRELAGVAWDVGERNCPFGILADIGIDEPKTQPPYWLRDRLLGAAARVADQPKSGDAWRAVHDETRLLASYPGIENISPRLIAGLLAKAAASAGISEHAVQVSVLRTLQAHEASEV